MRHFKKFPIAESLDDQHFPFEALSQEFMANRRVPETKDDETLDIEWPVYDEAKGG
jgi:hypothetical protein